MSAPCRSCKRPSRKHLEWKHLRSNWRTVLAWTAAISAGLFAGIGIKHFDREALAFAVLYLVGIALTQLGRRGLVGIVALGLLSLDTLLWMAAATVSNLQNQVAALAVLQPLALTITSVIGLVAAVLALLRSQATPRDGWPRVIAGLVAALVVTLAVETILAPSTAGSAAGLVLTIHNTAYSTTALRASSGQVRISVTNQDLFWHTFTIDQLHVNVAVPTGGHREITFSAPPGTYTFYCQIPGHRQAGMAGSITTG